MAEGWEIRPARVEEAERVSALAIRSKGPWGYGEEMEEKRAHLLEADGEPVGFYTLKRRSDEEMELEHLFVDPSRLGRGYGRAMFVHAAELARRLGHGRLVILSDPNAEGFYRALGCERVCSIPSSIPGRSIPIFHCDLSERVGERPAT